MGLNSTGTCKQTGPPGATPQDFSSETQRKGLEVELAFYGLLDRMMPYHAQDSKEPSAKPFMKDEGSRSIM